MRNVRAGTYSKEQWVAQTDLKQWRIQAWIKRIIRYIKKVIKLKGGNEYREGAIEVLRRLKAPKAVENEWEDIQIWKAVSQGGQFLGGKDFCEPPPYTERDYSTLTKTNYILACR